MKPAEAVARSRAEQGLPRHVEDPDAIAVALGIVVPVLRRLRAEEVGDAAAGEP